MTSSSCAVRSAIQRHETVQCHQKHQFLLQLPDDCRHACWVAHSSCGINKSLHAALTTPALSATTFTLFVHFVQDMYDKQRGKKRGLGSDADSDGGQIGSGNGSPAKKQLMSDEQVDWLLYYHNYVAHQHA